MRHLCVIPIFLLGIASTAFAGGDGNSTDGGINDTEARIESLTTQLGILQAEVSVAKAKHDLASLNASDGEDSSLPKVKSIYGVDGNLSATVIYEDGDIVPVKQGDRLHGGYVVDHVGRDGVVAKRGRHKVTLAFELVKSNSSTMPGNGVAGVGGAPLPMR